MTKILIYIIKAILTMLLIVVMGPLAISEFFLVYVPASILFDKEVRPIAKLYDKIGELIWKEKW